MKIKAQNVIELLEDSDGSLHEVVYDPDMDRSMDVYIDEDEYYGRWA